jgi:hypothetical protein
MSQPRRKLSDILNGGNSSFTNAWNSTVAAGDNAPLPRGEYVCHAINGELTSSKTKHTPGYKITFRVLEGEHAGRLVWHDLWLTTAALPRAKRALAELGITTPEQMEMPLPPGIRCKVVVVLKKDDDGIEVNEVRRFTVLGVDEAPANPYAPTDKPDAASGEETPT